jgi:hypothetical protein
MMSSSRRGEAVNVVVTTELRLWRGLYLKGKRVHESFLT